MDLKNLLKHATTDDLYLTLVDVLNALRTRGGVALDPGVINAEHATISRDEDGAFVYAYYSEASAEIALEERDPPIFTLDQAAAKLGVSAEYLAAFLEREKGDLIAEGRAHYEGDDLIIDGGGE